MAGAGGGRVKIGKSQPRRPSPAGGQEGVSEEPRCPGQSRVPGVLPYGLAERRWDGAPRRERGGKTSTARGTKKQGCPEKVGNVDPHMGPGTAGGWGRGGPQGVRTQERKQNKMPGPEEMVGKEVRASKMTHSHHQLPPAISPSSPQHPWPFQGLLRPEELFHKTSSINGKSTLTILYPCGLV